MIDTLFKRSQPEQIRGFQEKFFQQRKGLHHALQVLVVLACVIQSVNAQPSHSYVSATKSSGSFTLSASGTSAALLASSEDYPGVLRVLNHLQSDIERVTGTKPAIVSDVLPSTKEFILVGTLGKNSFIDKLVQEKKLRVDDLTGRREKFFIQLVEKPFPQVDRALVIVGSEKRGTIYGMYDLSSAIGVSPWYWWADVPVRKQSSLFVLPGRHTQGEPKVQYRGIFINDEAPALSGWAYEKFGGFNSKFYDHVFELILRLKGNFLWPAMWGRAFYVDDPVNPTLADEYGVVIGTSHHEPMMRAHAEWAQFGNGPWNYEKNESVLKNFWRQGIQRMGTNESIVTLAMRGDGDEPMTEESNIALLQKIVRDQRTILGDVTGKDITAIPQVWALYKEVQDYYDKGMRAPEDVTLLLCDDNWGNIRKLPKLTDPPHPGGYGIYYHYDYVGGPRNYKWLNTNQISRVWEQMHLAYEYGATRIWIVNVGDIKPMEFPIEFFLDYAWNPDQWPAERLPDYTRRWAEKQFGSAHAKEIVEILSLYTKYNSRRKPELLAPDTYSLVNYREAETIVADYNALADRAQRLYDTLSPEYKAAFYQLVLHPTLACSNLNELYFTVGKNRFYAQQGRAATNGLAVKARELYNRDTTITHYYNTILASGKWNHMMDQTHIGYTYWQQPETNTMPDVKEIQLPSTPSMGVAIEGSQDCWPDTAMTGEQREAVLPEFDVYHRQTYYIEVFNRGTTPFEYSVQSEQSWIKISSPRGTIDREKRLGISIDWNHVPSGRHRVPLTIAGPSNTAVIVYAVIHKPISPKREELNRFIESNNYISIEADHFTRAVNTHPITWQRIPDLGRTGSSMTPFPVTVPAQMPEGDSPRLEYSVHLFSKGEVTVKAYLSPTLNFHNNQGLRYGISFDAERPQIVNMHSKKTFQDWEESVRNNVTVEASKHTFNEPGGHVLKFWAVDPGVVLQKIVIETDSVRSSYLGPPESFHGTGKAASTTK
ncbi:MAG: glycosyl hydrolase 115 family protein [bacterium]